MAHAMLVLAISVSGVQPRGTNSFVADVPNREKLEEIAERHFDRVAGWFELDSAGRQWLRKELDRRIQLALAEARKNAEIRRELMKNTANSERSLQLAAELSTHDPYRLLAVRSLGDALKGQLPDEKWIKGSKRLDEESKRYVESLVKDYLETERREREQVLQSIPIHEQRAPVMPNTARPALLGKSRSANREDTRKLASPNPEWISMVGSLCTRMQLSSAQIEHAHKILSECSNRASAYGTAIGSLAPIVDAQPDPVTQAAQRRQLGLPLHQIESELRERVEAVGAAAR